MSKKYLENHHSHRRDVWTTAVWVRVEETFLIFVFRILTSQQRKKSQTRDLNFRLFHFPPLSHFVFMFSKSVSWGFTFFTIGWAWVASEEKEEELGRWWGNFKGGKVCKEIGNYLTHSILWSISQSRFYTHLKGYCQIYSDPWGCVHFLHFIYYPHAMFL